MVGGMRTLSKIFFFYKSTNTIHEHSIIITQLSPEVSSPHTITLGVTISTNEREEDRSIHSGAIQYSVEF